MSLASSHSVGFWAASALCLVLLVALPVLFVWGLHRWTNGAIIGWREQRRLVWRQGHQAPYFPQWAAERGMAYAPRDDAWVRVADPQSFSGTDPRAEHVFTGTVRGREVAAFQYSARLPETGGGQVFRDRRRRMLTYVAVRLPAPRPELLVFPGTAFDQASQRAGFAPVGLRYENPRFNERFRVTAESARFAHDVLTPRTMEWMLADPTTAQWPLLIQGTYLMTWHQEPILLDRLDGLIAMLVGFRDRIPDHVWDGPSRSEP